MPKLLSKDRFIQKMLMGSYWNFFKFFWPIVNSERFVPSWYIKRNCDELQTISERVFEWKPKEYDIITNCPPGTSKSSVYSIFWQPWIWTRMPTARVISGSYTERLALDHSRKSRDIILSEPYQRLFPGLDLRDDQNTKGFFINKQGGGRIATGVGGTITGFHAHFISIDDPLDPIGALSDLVINEANTWITETLSDRKVEKWLTPTALVMQRLHQNDPTGNWLERNATKPGKLRHICLPGDLQWEVKPEELKSLYSEDGLLDPVRVGRDVLEEASRRGEAYYACQYGQQPVPRGGSMFKIDRLKYESTVPTKWKKGPFRFWDKAVSLVKSEAAYTAGVKMALDFDDKVWILDVIRGRWDSGDRERLILSTARADGRTVRIGMEQEPNASGKEAAENSVKRLGLAGFRAEASIPKGDKPIRAESLSVQVNVGNVVIVNALWNRDFIEEMKFFPVSRYKDQMDAASGAYSMVIKTRIKIGVGW